MTTSPAPEILSVRAELRDDSPAVATATPRLSWTVGSAAPGWIQAWAEVRAGDVVVRFEGRDSVLVPWPFAPLAAGDVRAIEVRAASTDGAVTAWSEPLPVVAAFPAEWTARAIGLAAPTRVAQPVLLRRAFTLDRPVTRATLHWTALGMVDVEVNGEPADDVVLSPNWTDYHARLIHETTDVTSLLITGENVVGIRLAGAWYTEEYGILTKPKRFWGEQPRALAQLVLEFADGSTRVEATGAGWQATGDGPIVASGIYAGETTDARREPAGWSRPGFDASAWEPALVDDRELPVPEARIAPPIRRSEFRPVQEVLRSPSGALILDFGQNLVGRLRLRVAGPAGTEITLRHAEVLEDGELALRPLKSAKATDTFVLAGTGVEELEPRFTFHGFRYARVDGWPGELDPAAVEAVVLATDLRRTGWFASSDATLDRFHENVVQTLRGNYLAVPMDCPQRDERLGWTGDTQLFAPTASFLFDCHAFYLSWLRELTLEQSRLGGVVPLMAPNPLPGFGDREPIAAWGDTIAIMPRLLAERYGDAAMLPEFSPAIRDWADVLLRVRDDDALWTTGKQLGDWLDPIAPPNAPGRGRTDTDIVASAYLVHTLDLAARTAAELGEEADAARFGTEAARSRTAFLAAYVTPAGRMMGDTQTAYALALRLDVVTEPALRERLAARLAEVVRRDGYLIGTGIVGTAHIAPALGDSGHLEAAERLLFQTECPSWLYPVTVGATTVWERWDGLRPDGTLNPGAMISFNHVVLGAVGDWLHTSVAGLATAEPGYRRLRIAPRLLGRLDHARAEHHTPYGPASVAWRREADGVRLTVEVPPNTTADVVLGDLAAEVGSGTHEWLVATPPAPSRAAVTLDSTTAQLIDDEAAYRAFLATVAERNPYLAASLELNVIWSEGRTVRDALIFADQGVRDAVAATFAAVAKT